MTKDAHVVVVIFLCRLDVQSTNTKVASLPPLSLSVSLHRQQHQHDSWLDHCISTHIHSPLLLGRTYVKFLNRQTFPGPIIVFWVLRFLSHQHHFCCCHRRCCCFCRYGWQRSRQDLVLDDCHSIGKDKREGERENWDRSFTREKER